MSGLGFYEDASQLTRGSGFLLLVLAGHCEPRGRSKTFLLILGLLSSSSLSFLRGHLGQLHRVCSVASEERRAQVFQARKCGSYGIIPAEVFK